jgi:hypothetical protein
MKEVDCYVVRFPDHITLESLRKWGREFKIELAGRRGFGLLLDTNRHDFESVACLKWLRDYLTQDDVVKQAISKVAFVQPEAYGVSQVVSDYEAYFHDPASAKKWLNRD